MKKSREEKQVVGQYRNLQRRDETLDMNSEKTSESYATLVEQCKALKKKEHADEKVRENNNLLTAKVDAAKNYKLP